MPTVAITIQQKKIFDTIRRKAIMTAKGEKVTQNDIMELLLDSYISVNDMIIEL